LKNNASGFGIIEALLLLFVVLTIGGAGWFAWQRTQNNETESVAVKSEKPESNEKNVTTIAGSEYMKIPELGLKVKLDDSTKDLTYDVKSDGTVAISSKSLAAEEPKCAADYSPSADLSVASIFSFTDPDGYDISPTGEFKNSEMVDSVKVGANYYYISSAQSFCVNVGTNNKPQDKAYQLEAAIVQYLRSSKGLLEAL
jgi:hypothetical protein